MSGVTCAATTSRGYGCINAAKDGPFCTRHNPANWCRSRTLRGDYCKRVAVTPGGRCDKHGGVPS